MLPRSLLFLVLIASSASAVEGARSEMRKTKRIEPQEQKTETSPELPKPVPPVAVPRKAEETPTPLPLLNPGQGAHVQYFGHAFVYLTSRSGVRVGMNPFSDGSVNYPFPKNLTADIVLISSEAYDHSGGQHFFGLPQIFRSLTGLGANRANGLPFRGIETYRDNAEGRNLGKNAVYVLEMDNLRFCHLGTLGHPLNNKQSDAIGRVDVLFLPVGLPALSNRDLWNAVERLKAKWVVPVTYQTEKNKGLDLRPLSEFSLEGRPSRQVDGSEFTFSADTLPASPTILFLKAP